MLDRLQAMQRALEGRPHLARIGALFSETALLKVDGREFYLEFDRGRLARIAEGPSKKIPWRFALTTDEEALEAFWGETPAPGFHDIFAMAKIGRAEISGDILVLVKNLRFFKEFMALGREVSA